MKPYNKRIVRFNLNRDDRTKNTFELECGHLIPAKQDSWQEKTYAGAYADWRTCPFCKAASTVGTIGTVLVEEITPEPNKPDTYMLSLECNHFISEMMTKQKADTFFDNCEDDPPRRVCQHCKKEKEEAMKKKPAKKTMPACIQASLDAIADRERQKPATTALMPVEDTRIPNSGQVIPGTQIPAFLMNLSKEEIAQIAGQQSDQTIKDAIIYCYQESRLSMQRGTEWLLSVGIWLYWQAKSKKGRFNKWVNKNMPFGDRQAQKYMRLVDLWEKIKENAAKKNKTHELATMSLEKLLQLVATKAKSNNPKPRTKKEPAESIAITTTSTPRTITSQWNNGVYKVQCGNDKLTLNRPEAETLTKVLQESFILADDEAESETVEDYDTPEGCRRSLP